MTQKKEPHEAGHHPGPGTPFQIDPGWYIVRQPRDGSWFEVGELHVTEVHSLPPGKTTETWYLYTEDRGARRRFIRPGLAAPSVDMRLDLVVGGLSVPTGIAFTTIVAHCDVPI